MFYSMPACTFDACD